jgi:hypothetical protein
VDKNPIKILDSSQPNTISISNRNRQSSVHLLRDETSKKMFSLAHLNSTGGGAGAGIINDKSRN